MDKITEELMKERRPIHPKCRGEGFSELQQKFITSTHCSHIEPINVFGGEDKTVQSFTDEDCRCTSYVNPSYWWRHEDWRCPMGDHYRPDLEIKGSKARVGQQKQKKKK
jgi:hypothetical protein